ncbi:MAG: hypothetical protein IJZ68_06380 [Bacteroidaceae bacterium]|nr:hypothetical protein [Bacteroidaceae bacterium]
MSTYYFAFKVNPIDAMRCDFPRPNSQAYGAVCGSLEAANKWLNTAATPEHAQDWLYARYQLPAMDIVITGAAVDTRTTLPKLAPNETAPIFAHRMRDIDIQQVYAKINEDEVHDAHLLGASQGKDLSSENTILRGASSEMLTRMCQLEEYHRALEAHPEIPKEALKEWGTMMFAHGVWHHDEVPGYFEEFAKQYLQHVVVGDNIGPQYGVVETTALAMESTARYLYEELGSKDDDAFGRILEDYAEAAFPYKRERFMAVLTPENYKATVMQNIPERLQEQFSKRWDSHLMDLRLSNQVELRNGTVRIQDVVLQNAVDVATEMEYDSFRAKDGTQRIYGAIRSAAMQDQVLLEQFDYPEIDEPEEEIN